MAVPKMHVKEVGIVLHTARIIIYSNNKAHCNLIIICTAFTHTHIFLYRYIYIYYIYLQDTYRPYGIHFQMHIYKRWSIVLKGQYYLYYMLYIVCIVFAILIPGHAIVLEPILLYYIGIALRQNAACFYWKIVFSRNVTFIPTYVYIYIYIYL